MLGLYDINILSMPFKFSYPKLHISYSCRALRQSKILVRTHTQIPLSDLREPFEKYCQKLQSHLRRRSDLCLSELFHFSTTQGNVLATSKLTGMSMWLGISFMLASYPKKVVYQINLNLSSVLFLIRILYSGWAKVQCGGACYHQHFTQKHDKSHDMCRILFIIHLVPLVLIDLFVCREL
jgi:hypothetical protein